MQCSDYLLHACKSRVSVIAMFHSLRAFAVYAGLLMCHEHLHMLPDVWNCTCAVVLWMQYIEFPVLSLVLAGAAADLPSWCLVARRASFCTMHSIRSHSATVVRRNRTTQTTKIIAK